MAYQYSLFSGDEKTSKKLHKLAILNGIFNTPFDDTRAWARSYSAKTESIFRENSEYSSPTDMFGTEEMKHWLLKRSASKKQLDWKSSWRKDRVNEWRVFSQFRRTRLMLTSSHGDLDLVRKLIEDGAEADLIASATAGKEGDNGSALLMAIQGYARHICST